MTFFDVWIFGFALQLYSQEKYIASQKEPLKSNILGTHD